MRPSIVIGVVATLVALVPTPALACSCTNNLTLDQEFAAAGSVFSGRVSAIAPSPDPSYLAVQFEPITRWKGTLDATPVVLTPPNEGVCGFPFQVGLEYLVFASVYAIGVPPSAPVYYTHLCSRTGLLAGHPDLPNLPPPLVPTAVRARTWGALKGIYR